ncbi:MAG TPA: hypothetical protein VF800_21495 [Telluria sp.]
MPARATLFTALLLSSSPIAHAQPLPEMPPSPMLMFDDNAPRGRKEVSLATMNAEWRKFILKDTQIDKRGFLAVVVPAQFIGSLDAVKSAHVFMPMQAGASTVVAGLTLLGTVEESKNRKEYLFGRPVTASAMLTVWKYKEDGGSINVVSDFLNQSIDGTPATLSLATTPNSKQCQWKLGVVDDKVSYEVVLTDTLSDKHEPSMTLTQALATIHALVSFAKKQN